ncbi:MAG TPA: XRE family transcriptional regulator, partial [Candidatus Baltobacteraceae bacterium]
MQQGKIVKKARAKASDGRSTPSTDGRGRAVPEARASESQTLEGSVGIQVRAMRKRQDMTVTDLASAASLSIGMLSKIENGATSASLGTLQALAQALNVPVGMFFAKFDEKRDATFVRSGNGLPIERRGTRSGHLYQLLGHSVKSDISVEPYLITLTDEADPYPIFQHEGVEFIYMLSGEVGYRHADKTYILKKGDSLFFDAKAAHGPEELRKLPMTYLSIIVSP